MGVCKLLCLPFVMQGGEGTRFGRAASRKMDHKVHHLSSRYVGDDEEA